MTTTRRGVNFVRRIYPPRIVGLGLGFFCVASVFYQQHAHPLAWALLVFHGFIWAHLAYWRSIRSDDPRRTEQHNLLIDSLLGGLWVPLMSFNILPSFLIIVMLSMDNIATNGLRLFWRGLVAHLLGGLVAIALVGLNFNLLPTLPILLACLPFLTVYPIMVGIITYRLSIKLAEQKEILQQLSRTDGLSGLHNRAYWEERASQEFARSRRNGKPAVLILLDIDHFKRINDEHGHAVGDEVLREVAQLLRANLRPFDVIGRYGGEEFGIVLPDADRSCAWAMAERLRETVAQAASLGCPNPCTISLGVAPLTAEIQGHGQWLQRADKALYYAKQQGRNRSVVFDELPGLADCE